jgi:cytochrome c biogenesis protein CcmG/thiol:disulfide interchange protein DsbE
MRAGLRWVVLSCLALASACGPSSPGENPAIGKAFPELRLPGLNGKSSPPRMIGRSAVVNVWATWCEPCRREMPSLARLAADADPRKLVVVGISIDADPNLAREFVLREHVGFPNFSDPGGAFTRDSLDVQALPMTFLVRSDGTLAARVAGPHDWSGFEGRRMLGAQLGLAILSTSEEGKTSP